MIKNLFNLNKNKDKKAIKQEIESPYLTILRDFTDEEKQEISLVKNYTMTGNERLVTLSRSIEYIVENNIEGDIVECGVWKGGSMMMVANKLAKLKCLKKSLYLFDTYEGMTEPGMDDISWNALKAGEIYNEEKMAGKKWCYSTLEEVVNNLNKTKYPRENIFYIKGKVEDTLPHPPINKISLLRLDTDWYDSTKHELECLYDKIVIGGVLIIDDYGHWKGAQKAVDEFIKERKLMLFLNRIDYTGRLAIKF